MPQKQKESKESKNKNLWSRIKDGCSFVDDNSRLSSWLFASDPHGTQMANLICAIDPLCDLYVEKVTEGRYGISPGRVAKVSLSVYSLLRSYSLTLLTPPYGQGNSMGN